MEYPDFDADSLRVCSPAKPVCSRKQCVEIVREKSDAALERRCGQRRALAILSADLYFVLISERVARERHSAVPTDDARMLVLQRPLQRKRELHNESRTALRRMRPAKYVAFPSDASDHGSEKICVISKRHWLRLGTVPRRRAV
jgi:hypothetical protein